MKLRSTEAFEGARIRALEGDIGHFEQFYFDDQTWRINYVVVKIGGWLHGKRVLISPEAITSVEDDHGLVIHVALTTEQVRESLDAHTHVPISLQQPHDYYLYLGLPHYVRLTPGHDPDRTDAETYGPSEPLLDPGSDEHLRSSKIVSRYHIMAVDGEIGHVEDFVLDDETWTIRYAIADTRNWWPGKKILLSTEWIYWISWAESNAYVGLTRERIAGAPEFHSERPLTRDDEAQLYDYYQRRPYWEFEQYS